MACKGCTEGGPGDGALIGVRGWESDLRSGSASGWWSVRVVRHGRCDEGGAPPRCITTKMNTTLTSTPGALPATNATVAAAPAATTSTTAPAAPAAFVTKTPASRPSKKAFKAPGMVGK